MSPPWTGPPVPVDAIAGTERSTSTRPEYDRDPAARGVTFAGPASPPSLSWVRVCDGAPYFETEDGASWSPIGHNEAITWPHLVSSDARIQYFRALREHGVTCLRLMLEYAQDNSHFLECPTGTFNPRVIGIWDDVFRLAEQHGIRLLLTPFDTFWMWRRWDDHPYNRRRGGPCDATRRLLTCSVARAAIKARLAFVIDRWGHSGALFAWDLWNEIHPAFAEDDPGHFDCFISDVAGFVRERERSRYGRTHPLTVSAFGPMLADGFRSDELGDTRPDPRASAAIFRHPLLDFATVHTYATGTIDAPSNTVDAAMTMGALTRTYIGELCDQRPYFDSEHGPIHTFKDEGRILPESFDDEYFRHLQWAHLASGGAGGGMRWPNRAPHHLTPGMHAAQAAMARFLPSVDWRRFRRRNISDQVTVDASNVAAFCCGDADQAVLWLLRRSGFNADGMLTRATAAQCVRVTIPGFAAGAYDILTWDTEAGVVEQHVTVHAATDGVRLDVNIARDVAVRVQRC